MLPFARVIQFGKHQPCRLDTTLRTHHHLAATQPNQSQHLYDVSLDQPRRAMPTTFQDPTSQTSLIQPPRNHLYPIAEHCDLSCAPIQRDTLQSLGDHKSPFHPSEYQDDAAHLQSRQQVLKPTAEWLGQDDPPEFSPESLPPHCATYPFALTTRLVGQAHTQEPAPYRVPPNARDT